MDKVFSIYNYGFVESGTNNNVYYDTNSVPIAIGTDDFTGFTSNPVNIPRNQVDDTGNYLQMDKGINSDKINTLCWKVTANGVRIDIYEITASAIAEIINTYGLNGTNNLVRFSNGVNTTDERIDGYHMNTAWDFFQETIGYWYGDQRGFTVRETWLPYSQSPAKPGASAANLYDNILQIPVVSAKREIYINHVDEDGNVLAGFENSELNMVIPAGTTRLNSEPRLNYQEHYTIEGSEKISVRKSSKTKVTGDNNTYTFVRGVVARGPDLNAAENNFNFGLKYVWNIDPTTFGINENNVDDVIVINLVYSKEPPPPPATRLPNIQIIGRLEFINTQSGTPYYNSSSGPTLDFIPAGKELRPYVNGAYPYVVRALRYERMEETGNISADISITQPYSWRYWEFEHHDSSSTTNGVTTTSCTSSCKYYPRTGSSSTSKSFTYTVPYKHVWYKIVNFKMYKISKVEVYDNNSNIGGTLFGGGMYIINPSSSYESKFNNSSGKINKTLTVTFPDKSYSLSNVYRSSSSPDSGESDAEDAADSALNAVTAQAAANHENLSINYKYDNDFIQLDGMPNLSNLWDNGMLQRNYKDWSEHINSQSNTTRELNSTKTGTNVPGTNISYTSNLGSFMTPPTTKLTTQADFSGGYQTVPTIRENGIRELTGKIIYTLVTDSKYNVGTNVFTSTDATYQLNTNKDVIQEDFADQSKIYRDNDVNKVNVLTPMRFATFELSTPVIVNHSVENNSNSSILQKNAIFNITPIMTGSSVASYSNVSTTSFVKGFYYIFSFDVLYTENGVEKKLAADTPIYKNGSTTTFSGKTTDSFGSGTVEQLTNRIRIEAVAINSTQLLDNYYKSAKMSETRFMDNREIVTNSGTVQNQKNLLTRTDIVGDANHLAYYIINTYNVGRIFDFAVTDCTDLEFKDIFKTSVSGNVNKPTGIIYYSGIKKWNLYNPNLNEMETNNDLGTIPKRIIPLGPYKNLNTKYINAPKMGYRISFDLKTTGFMDSNNSNGSRTVEITPSYYYISKDGKTFIPPSNLKLYFKNANGSYKNFSSSGYTIYYKPNDGYRYLRNSIYTDDNTMMSTKLEPLNVSSIIKLTNKSMGTNNSSFIQSWYGEFKLPNSTIAVANGGDINNPCKDGYIGVIFKIVCKDTITNPPSTRSISYSQQNRAAGSPVDSSQWDYEGFMNFDISNPNKKLRYQLEKGMWEIDNSRYREIRGSVVLFDLDNRAANDFE
ncbi:MAG: hypothetical protein PHD15_01645 [Clostridia bacterium]|nr:hypothetical protein [Clostridia bacterium]MDD4386454.1 hypothetical protein [Clostridia bacterium]